MNRKYLSVLVGCLCVTAAASAAIIPINGDGADQKVPVAAWVGQPEIRVSAESAVFVFELPVLPAGEWVDTADFAFSVVGGSNWRSLGGKGLDLYGVRMSSDSTVLMTDHYNGVFGGDANGTAIEQNIVFEAEALNQSLPSDMGRHDTTAASEAALGAWIKSLYESSTYNPAGTNFAFLRVNGSDADSDNPLTTSRYWSLGTASWTSEPDRPLLTLSTVPEPASIGLLACGALALVRRRK